MEPIVVQAIGMFTYVFLFAVYTLLIGHPRATVEEKLFFALIFGIGIIVPTSVIWQ